MTILDATSITWDFIVVGTGMGGGAAGYKLAELGHRVLFVERGLEPSLQDIRGEMLEEAILRLEELGKAPAPTLFARSGRSLDTIQDTSRTRSKRLFPLLGSGVGGSSALYGMAMERWTALELQGWPCSLADLMPFYQEAECLLHAGPPKPIRLPENQTLASHLMDMGLKVTPLTLACLTDPQCRQCQSFLCPKACKVDSAQAFVKPATTKFRATLLADCSAERLVWSQNQAQRLMVTASGQSYELKARHFVLALGALHTPLLLMRSEVPDPSHQTGRNLMRHLSDLYMLDLLDPQDPHVPTKELGARDLLNDALGPFGVLQSFGRMPSLDVVLWTLKRDFEQAMPGLGSAVFRLMRPMLARFLRARLMGRITLASLLEDFPHPDNRVWLAGGNIHFHYKIGKAEQRRIKMLRRHILEILQPYRPFLLKNAEDNRYLAHICGTTRMGSDKNTSVLNEHGRHHVMGNLWVADASTFPTSGNANPALTIAANALRIANHIHRHAP